MPAQSAKVYSKIILRELRCILMHMLLYFVFVYCLFSAFVPFFFSRKKEKDRRDGYWNQTHLVNVKFTDNVIKQSVQVI